MFSITLTLALAMFLAGAASATEVSAQPCVKSDLSDGGYASEAIDGHIRAQLDWRSYYLNRFAASRSVESRGEVSPQQPR
jgi:hypothetical protein